MIRVKQFLMRIFCLLLAVLCCVNLFNGMAKPSFGQEFAPHELPNPARKFLTQHCVECHHESADESEFRIDNLRSVSGDNLNRWKEIANRVKAAEMPPPEFSNQPPRAARDRFHEWLEDAIRRFETEQMRDTAPIQFKRLTRTEYANTIQELLGVQVNADVLELCEDEDWHGIKRIGSRLTMSATHMAKYLETAEALVEESIPDSATDELFFNFDAIDLAGGEKRYGAEAVKKMRAAPVKPRIDLWPGQSISTSMLAGKTDRPLPPGIYQFRIRISGMANSANGHPPHLTIVDSRTGLLLFEKDVVSPESEPIEIEFQAHLSGGPRRIEIENEVNGPLILARLGRSSKPFFNLKDGYLPWQVDFVGPEGKPNFACLAVDSVEINGPVISHESSRIRSRLVPESNEPDEIKSCLSRFMSRAFRRPVTPDEVERYAEFVLSETKRGETLKAAARSALVAVLCSKDFLFLVEGSGNQDLSRLNDWELASRLSYFLWSTMPDEKLFELAREGRLSERKTLAEQVRRMLVDVKTKRFAQDFSRQWLLLDRVGEFKPNSKLYPEYDPFLERSMTQETTLFFERVLEENLSVHDFILSDWAMLNPRLARFYGIELPAQNEEDGFRRVALSAKDRRGGLLTQAAILSLTSDGLRQRPIHRGVWVYEQILGRSMPSPPANVAAIEPATKTHPKSTFRDQLADHISNPNCASCHRKLDPLGFAFENYDAIGRWRTTELTATGTGEEPRVDASGTFPNGRSFADAREFQERLMDDLDEIQLALIKKLASYATRRVMTSADESELKQIAERSAANGCRLRDLVEAIVLSKLFQQR